MMLLRLSLFCSLAIIAWFRDLTPDPSSSFVVCRAGRFIFFLSLFFLPISHPVAGSHGPCGGLIFSVYCCSRFGFPRRLYMILFYFCSSFRMLTKTLCSFLFDASPSFYWNVVSPTSDPLRCPPAVLLWPGKKK